MWNGAFSPNLRKHRDYAHNTYFEHEMANGAEYELSPGAVKVETNPIDEGPFEPSREYYMMDFRPHSGEQYLYLIPAEPDKSEPNFVRIRDTMDEYARNPVEATNEASRLIRRSVRRCRPWTDRPTLVCYRAATTAT